MDQAGMYSKSNVLQRQDSLFVLKRYMKLVKWDFDAEETVLDVGCGDGNVLNDLLIPLLPKNVRKVVGNDVSKEMIEFARKRNYGKDVEFVVADIGAKDAVDKVDDVYDHIFSFFCLHWVVNQRNGIENLYKLLKPNGDMLLTFLASNPVFDIYENLAKYKTWSKYMWDVEKFVSPYHHSKDPEAALSSILKETGFNIGTCRVLDRNFVFKDLGVWRKIITSVNPFLSRIPESLKEEYMEDYLEECRQMNCLVRNENNNEDTVVVKYKLFVVYAYK